MKFKYQIIVLTTFLISCQSINRNRISINIPTVKTESEYIWRTIQDVKFFEENNYQISLPKGQIVEELKVKSKSGNLVTEDYVRLERFVMDSVYDESDYRKGFEKIVKEAALINKMINQLNKSKFNWAFKTFETYSLNLTLYGPGGSYNPDEGSILIYTTPTGQFKNYDNPANTIIHEVVHIGIEEAIITKYNVPHALKERIVDTFVSLNFGQDLPDYRIQDMGDKRTDQYLTSISSLKDLDKIIEQLTNKE